MNVFMRVAALATPALLALICHVPPARAQGKLTPAQEAWLSLLQSAPFTDPARANGCSISALNAAVFSEHLLPVLANASSLSAEQRSRLEAIVRIEVDAPGWVSHYPVTPGVHTIGLRQGKHNLQLVAKDASGTVMDIDSAWLRGSSASSPVVSATEGNDGIKLKAAWGDVAFTWIYVSRAAHTAALGNMPEYKSGPVSVFSDLPRDTHAQRIADLCAAALPANEMLTGMKAPQGFRYELYVTGSGTVYNAVDMLLTGGEFSRNGAFTSRITGRSYVWHHVHYGPGHVLPVGLLQVCIHELHHQFIYATVPCMRYVADWWGEGLAEVAAQRGMELCDWKAAAQFRKRRLSEAEFFARAGRLPQPADLFANKSSTDVAALYTALWCIGHVFASKPEDLQAMCSMAAEYELAADMDSVLRREFESRYPNIPGMLEAARAQTASDAQGYVELGACVDERDGVMEVNSAFGRGGFALLNRPQQGAVCLEGEFRWDDMPRPQVDFVMGYTRGTVAERFVKVGLLPTRAIFFTCMEGQWATIGTLDYDTALAVTDGGKALWHRFKVTFDGVELRLETTNGRRAEFKLDVYWPLQGTYAGVGTHNGVAWFRDLATNK